MKDCKLKEYLPGTVLLFLSMLPFHSDDEFKQLTLLKCYKNISIINLVMNIIFPMLGSGSRFLKAGIKTPKYLLDLARKSTLFCFIWF